MLSAALLAAGLTLARLSSPAMAQDPTPSETPLDRPFVDLFANLVHDVRALPSKATLQTLAVGTGLGLALHPVDDNVADWVQKQPAASYTSIGRVLGDGWTQAGIAIGTYVAGVASSHDKTRHVGADLIRGQVLTGLITRGLKVGVDRTRPSGGGDAFPSGHTSASFLTASVVSAHYGWKAGLPAYGLAGFVGWTRIRDNAHWVTDIIGGATVGEIIGRTVTAKHGTRQWTVNVSPTIGGMAVFVTKMPPRRGQTGSGNGHHAAR